MNARLPSPAMLVPGVVLIAAGLALWRQAPVDLALLHALRLDLGPVGAARLAWFSALGGFAVMGPVAIVATVLLVARGRRADALWLTMTIASGRLLVEGVKLALERPRPPVAERLELVTSWSFPSSHSAGTMMTALAFALLASRRRREFFAAALLWTGLIGWSRLALAVHWPSDVLAGWGLGMLWVGAATRWMPHRRA